MASFRWYDNSDVIAFLIMTNFHLYLIKLWWQFFQMFVYGDVVMLRIGTYWPWKTVTVSSHLHMSVWPMLLHRMALISCRLYGIFWASSLTPPLAKNFPYAYGHTTRGLTTRGFYNQGFLQPGVLEPGVITTRGSLSSLRRDWVCWIVKLLYIF